MFFQGENQFEGFVTIVADVVVHGHGSLPLDCEHELRLELYADTGRLSVGQSRKSEASDRHGIPPFNKRRVGHPEPLIQLLFRHHFVRQLARYHFAYIVAFFPCFDHGLPRSVMLSEDGGCFSVALIECLLVRRVSTESFNGTLRPIALQTVWRMERDSNPRYGFSEPPSLEVSATCISFCNSNLH